MKTLTNEEIITIIENCKNSCDDGNNCPLFKECYYYFTGDKIGSTLETSDTKKEKYNEK